MARLPRFWRFSWLWLAPAVTSACGQSTSSSEGRGSDASGGSAGSTGTGATAGDGGGAGLTGGSSGGGTSGSAGTAGSGNPGGAPGVDISGPWAMFAFEDPVAVSLSQDGTVLSGFGCCAGLNSTLVDCCGEIAGGSIVDRRAAFEFSFTVHFDYTYSAKVFVSADGQRMLGSFNQGGLATAWVPLTGNVSEGIGWLRSSDAILDEAMRARAGQYELLLTGAPAGGAAYGPDTPYSLTIWSALPTAVYGDLGPFWAGEMTWQEDEQTLVIGPVPLTDPAYPIALRLRFEDVVLSAVEAEMSSGDRYLFSAALP